MAFDPKSIDNSNKRRNSHKESMRRIHKFIGISEFEKAYSSPEKILKLIFEARCAKTNGLCPNPKCTRPLKKYTKIEGKLAYRCACGKKVSPLKGTPLENTHVKLNIVWLIIYKIFQSSHGYEVTAVVKDKYIRRYRHALNFIRKISDWMMICVNAQPLTDGTENEVDEVYCAVDTGKRRSRYEKREKIPVFTLVERQTGLTKIYVTDSANTANARKIFQSNFNKTHIIYTDDSPIYKPLREEYDIFTTKHKTKEYAKNQIVEIIKSFKVEDKDGKETMVEKKITKEILNTTNKVERFNRSIKMSIHRVKNAVGKDHLPEYLYQMAFVHSFAGLSVIQVIDKLLQCLPPLFEDGVKRTNNKPYQSPENPWKQAA